MLFELSANGCTSVISTSGRGLARLASESFCSSRLLASADCTRLIISRPFSSNPVSVSLILVDATLPLPSSSATSLFLKLADATISVSERDLSVSTSNRRFLSLESIILSVGWIKSSIWEAVEASFTGSTRSYRGSSKVVAAWQVLVVDSCEFCAASSTLTR